MPKKRYGLLNAKIHLIYIYIYIKVQMSQITNYKSQNFC